MNVMKELNVVAAIIFEDNKVLTTKRGYGEFVNLWEFPGGKVEQGESEEKALIREIEEELNVLINVEKFALDLEYQYSNFYLYMSCFECTIEKGTIKLLEHSDVKWLNKNDLNSVKWIPADIEIINYLKNKEWE